MATTYNVGSQSPTSLSRTLERVFDDAQHTGEIQLSGRKLRDYPKLASKYDLVDTISTDLSKNRLSDVPKDVCTYGSMEKLDCYHNVIKSVPEALIQLQALTHLNLSRNQLSIIPSFISQLQLLEVLLASHNRLVSLPEEIGVLDRLMQLDVSCNEISHLPMQIGDLKSLKSLNVRRNLLVELPVEISKLNLRKLDFSANRISKIPTHFRKIETLEEIILDHNPLTLPPAYVCTKGRQHIMKFLQIEAIKEDKKRGILNDVEMKRFRKSLPPQQSVSSEDFRNLLESPENKWKRHTVLSSDSGYSTTDEKCGWSPQENNIVNSHIDEANNLAARTATGIQEPRYQPARGPESQHWAARERISPDKPQISPDKPQQYIVARTHNSVSPDKPQISPEKPQILQKPQISPRNPQSYLVTRGRNSPSIDKPQVSEKPPYYPPAETLPPYSAARPNYSTSRTQVTGSYTVPHSQGTPIVTGSQQPQRAPTLTGSPQSNRAPAFTGSPQSNGPPTLTGSQQSHGVPAFSGSPQSNGPPTLTGSQQYQSSPQSHLTTFSSSQHYQGPPATVSQQHNGRPTFPGSQHTHESQNFTGSQPQHTQYPPSPLSPQTPPTPQGPGPGSDVNPTASEDEFTMELQRQKLEYESKKKLAEQLRRQQDEEDEREQRRRAAQRIQDEQRALLDRQREDASQRIQDEQRVLLDRQREDAARAQEQARVWEEQRQREANEAARLEEIQRQYEESQRVDEARRQEEQRQLEQRQSEEARQHRVEHNYYHGNFNSNYNNSNSAWMPPPPPSLLTSSPSSPIIEHEHEPPYVPCNNSMVDPFNNYSLHNYRKPVQSSNSFKEDRRTLTGPQLYRRTVSDSNQRLPVHKPQSQPPVSLPRPSYPVQNGPIEESSVNGSSRLPTPTEPNTDSSFNSENSTPPRNDMSHTNGTTTDEDKPTTQHSTVVRRPKAADRVQSAPATSSMSKVSKLTERHGRATTASTTSRTGVPSARKNHLTAEEELRRSQPNTKGTSSTETQKVRGRLDDQRLRTIQKESTSSYLNRRSTGSTSSEDDKKRSTPTRTLAYSNTAGKRTGTVMTSAQVKALEAYKDGDPNYTMRRQEHGQRDEHEQMDILRKTISTRLKRTLPDNLSEALSDGVLLCYLANQIRPRSVASVLVPSPAVPKLTPAKCRRNVDNFLEACRKIGVTRDQICACSDIIEGKGVGKVAITVAALVALATHTKHAAVV